MPTDSRTQAQHAAEVAARLVDQVVDYAIIGLDASGTIETWNAGAERLKGYTEAEAVGSSFAMFYPEKERHEGLPLQLLEQARRDGRVEHTGWRVRKDGSTFWGNVIITALHEDGHLVGFAKVTRDMTEQHALQVDLERNEERFRLLVGQVRDYAIIALDASGTIETWNAGAQRLKRYTEAEAVGRNVAIFYTDEDRRAGLPLRLLEEARRNGSVHHTGWRKRKDGTVFWGDVTITALHDAGGALTGFAKVTRDLTDRKRMDEARDTFFTSFAHDFQAPITSLRSVSQQLRDADPDDKDRLVDRIQADADRLVSMMHDLVAHATVRAEATVGDRRWVPVAEAARAAVAALPPDLDAGRVIVADRGAEVHADPAALHRILLALLDNALSYSMRGEVRVDTTRRGDRLTIAVIDRGRGIDARDLPVVFDEFQRGRLAQDDGRTGLGLTSVKSLAEQHGGRAWITSTLGEGTTVSVELEGRSPGPPG